MPPSAATATRASHAFANNREIPERRVPPVAHGALVRRGVFIDVRPSGLLDVRKLGAVRASPVVRDAGDDVLVEQRPRFGDRPPSHGRPASGSYLARRPSRS